jgi:GTPase SAR1 family protein
MLANSKENTSPKQVFKVMLLGSEGVGKTVFLKRHIVGVFDSAHNRKRAELLSKAGLASPEIEVTPLQLRTTRGPIEIKFWEIGSKNNQLGLEVPW